jgi:hypothetical protein
MIGTASKTVFCDFAGDAPESVLFFVGEHEGGSFVHGVVADAQEESLLELGGYDVETHALVDEGPLLGLGVCGSVLDDWRASGVLAALDGQAHLAPHANDHVVVGVAGLHQLPPLVAPAAQLLLDDGFAEVERGAGEVEVEAGVGELKEGAVEDLVFATDALEFPAALAGSGVGLPAL